MVPAGPRTDAPVAYGGACRPQTDAPAVDRPMGQHGLRPLLLPLLVMCIVGNSGAGGWHRDGGDEELSFMHARLLFELSVVLTTRLFSAVEGLVAG